MAQIDVITDTNYSALTVNPYDTLNLGEGATLTINSSTVDALFRIIASSSGHIRIENSSTTTPIFVWIGAPSSAPVGNQRYIRVEGSATFTVDGGLIELGTGNGVAGQTFNLPQDATSTNCPNLGGLWVEGTETLRDGTPVKTNYIRVTDADYTAALNAEPFNRVFKQDTTANTVTFKTAIPSGQKVYMANVVIRQATNNRPNDTWFDFNPGAKVSMTNCHVETLRPNFSGASSVYIRTVAFAEPEQYAQWLYTGAPADVETFIVNTTTNRAWYNQQETELGSLRNVWFNGGGSADACYIQASGVDVEGMVITGYGMTLLGSRTALNIIGFDCKFRDVFIGFPGSGIQVSAGRRILVDNYEMQPGCSSSSTGAQYNRNFLYISNTQVYELRNLTLRDSAVTGAGFLSGRGFEWNQSTDRGLLENITVHSGAVGSGNNRLERLFQNSTGRVAVNNVTMHGDVRNNFILSLSETNDATWSNIRAVDTSTNSGNMVAPGMDTRLQQVTNPSTNNDSSPNGVNHGCRSALLYRNGDTDRTTGTVHMYFTDPAYIDDQEYYEAITQTGRVEFSRSSSGVRIENKDDVVAFTSEVYENIVGASGTFHQINGTNEYDIEVAVRRPNDTWSSYETASTANISAINTLITSLPPDAQNRVQFKFKIRYANSTYPTRGLRYSLARCRLDLDLSGALATFERPAWMDDSVWDSKLVDRTQSGTFGEMLQQTHLNSLAAASVRIETIE